MIKTGQWQEALSDVGRAIDLEPLSGCHWAARGVILWRMQRHTESFEALSRAFELGVEGVSDILKMLRSATPAPSAHPLASSTPDGTADEDGMFQSTRKMQLAKLDSARRKLRAVTEGWGQGGEQNVAWAQLVDGLQEELERSLRHGQRPVDSRDLIEAIIAALSVDRGHNTSASMHGHADGGQRSATRGLLRLRQVSPVVTATCHFPRSARTCALRRKTRYCAELRGAQMILANVAADNDQQEEPLPAVGGNIGGASADATAVEAGVPAGTPKKNLGPEFEQLLVPVPPAVPARTLFTQSGARQRSERSERSRRPSPLLEAWEAELERQTSPPLLPPTRYEGYATHRYSDMIRVE